MQKTISSKIETVKRNWLLVDLRDQVLGRAASQIAAILRGKHKVEFTPHMDAGDFVVVINAEKVKLTGNKLADKLYYHHSNYPGGLKATPAGKQLAKHPERLLEDAVKRMLPHTPLGRQLCRKLKVYAGPTHPHTAQNPAAYKLAY